MLKKVMIVTLASLVLGGCSLDLKTLMGEGAVSDQQEAVATATPGPTADPELQAQPSPGTGTDEKTLETDVNNTTILEEDFSDLN